MKVVKNRQITGDAVVPENSDLIAQVAILNVGQPVPEGWRVMTGNTHVSQIARVALRSEIELGL